MDYKNNANAYGKYSKAYEEAYGKEFSVQQKSEGFSKNKGWKGTFIFPIVGTIIGRSIKSEAFKEAERHSDAKAAKAAYDAASEAKDTKELGKLANLKAKAEYIEKHTQKSNSYTFAFAFDDLLAILFAPFIAIYDSWKENKIKKGAEKAGREAEAKENASHKAANGKDTKQNKQVTEQSVQDIVKDAEVPTASDIKTEARKNTNTTAPNQLKSSSRLPS